MGHDTERVSGKMKDETVFPEEEVLTDTRDEWEDTQEPEEQRGYRFQSADRSEQCQGRSQRDRSGDQKTDRTAVPDRQALWGNPWGHFFRFGEKYSAISFISNPVFLICTALSYNRTE